MPCVVLFYQCLHVYPSFRPWFLETNTVQSHSFILVHVYTVKQTPCAVFTKKIVLYTILYVRVNLHTKWVRGHSANQDSQLTANLVYIICVYQCSQSVWYVRFWVSRFRIKNYLYGSGSGSRFFHQQAKQFYKTSISTVLWLLNTLLSFENWCKYNYSK